MSSFFISSIPSNVFLLILFVDEKYWVWSLVCFLKYFLSRGSLWGHWSREALPCVLSGRTRHLDGHGECVHVVFPLNSIIWISVGHLCWLAVRGDSVAIIQWRKFTYLAVFLVWEMRFWILSFPYFSVFWQARTTLPKNDILWCSKFLLERWKITDCNCFPPSKASSSALVLLTNFDDWIIKGGKDWKSLCCKHMDEWSCGCLSFYSLFRLLRKARKWKQYGELMHCERSWRKFTLSLWCSMAL